MTDDSLEEIYRKHSRFVYRFLYNKTQDKTLAEELTQETFYQALRSIDRFEGKSLITTWLCGIALNVWYTYIKKERKLVFSPELSEDSFEISMQSDLLKDMIEKQDQERFQKEIQGLPCQMRKVIQLRIVGEYSFREIGGLMGKTEGWARVMFYRGKQNLVKGMDDDEA